jgi:hypothetical protein
MHQPWGLTATACAGRFVFVLDDISANKKHASGKEAELERAEIEIGTRKSKMPFHSPSPKG